MPRKKTHAIAAFTAPISLLKKARRRAKQRRSKRGFSAYMVEVIEQDFSKNRN